MSVICGNGVIYWCIRVYFSFVLFQRRDRSLTAWFIELFDVAKWEFFNRSSRNIFFGFASWIHDSFVFWIDFESFQRVSNLFRIDFFLLQVSTWFSLAHLRPRTTVQAFFFKFEVGRFYEELTKNLEIVQKSLQRYGTFKIEIHWQLPLWMHHKVALYKKFWTKIKSISQCKVLITPQKQRKHKNCII